MIKQVVVCATAIATLATSSCTDESQSVYEASGLSNLNEEQMEKVAYGCTSYTAADDGDEKVETSATEEYIDMLRERISEAEAESGNKAVATSQYVGVIKDQTCGKYDEIRIYYDCEDKRNKTKSGGFVGGWHVTHNITMRFWMVPANLFKRTKNYYAVMNFSPDTYFQNDKGHRDVGLLHVYMDAEDSNSGTDIFYTKNGGMEERDKYGFHSHKARVEGNGNLSFQLFYFKPNDNSTENYPDLGFDYGVFGLLYPEDKENKYRQGYVYSDDEDKNNGDYMRQVVDKEYTNLKDADEVGAYDFYGIIKVDGNTTFHIAKIFTKK